MVSTFDDFEKWLGRHSPEISIAIAARAALRALPALSTAVGARPDGNEFLAREVFLPCFRDVAALWARARYNFIDQTTFGRAQTPPTKIVMPTTYDEAAVAAAEAARMALMTQFPSDNRATAIAVIHRTVDAATTVGGLSSATIRAKNAGIDWIDDREATASIMAARDFESEVIRDANKINSETSARELASQSLWSQGEPDWAFERWRRLRRVLIERDEDWQVWATWYDDRRTGSTTNPVLEIARVTIADEIWQQGPKTLNAEIRRLMRQHEQLQPSARPISVPAQEPAAIETLWEKGKLRVPRKPAKSSLTKNKLEAAFAALRAELLELAADVNAEGNIDKRPAEFLQRLANRIPEKAPRQDELFRLGHAETIF